MFKPNENLLQEYIDSNVNVTTANLRSQIKHIRSPKIEKIKYLKSLFLLKKVVKKLTQILFMLTMRQATEYWDYFVGLDH